MLLSSCAPVLLLLLASACHGALKLPDYIKPCARDDPDFNECAKKSAINAIPKFINGDPKYRVPTLDPMKVTELKIDEGTRSVGMKMIGRNATLSGLKNVEMRATRFDFDKKRIEYDWYFPKLMIDCDYNVTGQVLLLPITGNGKGKFTLTDVIGNYSYDYDIVKKKDNREYMVPKNPQFNFKPKRMAIHLENLFNGDKFLGDNMNKFLNDNWDEILRDVGAALEEAIGGYINQILTNVFSLVPLDDAIPQTL